MDSWNPINLEIIGHPLNWLLVAFVFILMCVLVDAIMRYQQSQQNGVG